MCVAFPSPIVSITPGVMTMAKVQHGDNLVDCNLAYVPEAKVGDYVLIQHGFAVDLLDPESAAQSLAAFAELGVTA
jgi:hydrogenase expression/formation protein HypC